MRLPRYIIPFVTLLATPAWSTPAEQAALLAQRYVGSPYRYGGASPADGFDCSGLVQYVYAKVGIEVPRTVRYQLAAVQPVSFTELQPGDLLFFRLRSGRRLHVGIYLGDHSFVHAPSRGKRVSTSELSNWWQSHLTGAGRIPPSP